MVLIGSAHSSFKPGSDLGDFLSGDFVGIVGIIGIVLRCLDVQEEIVCNLNCGAEIRLLWQDGKLSLQTGLINLDQGSGDLPGQT